MSELQDLIGDLSTISDEELEELMIHGRLARERAGEPKARATRENKVVEPKISAEDLADFD